MNKAPYDKRNEADFQEVTENIEAALTLLERDPSIPATEANLAKRAKCSRGTLRHRKWPLQRLKAIKHGPEHVEDDTPIKITREHLKTVEVHIEEKKQLSKKLDDSRSETAVWVVKHGESQSEKKKLLRAIEVLKKARSTDEDKIRALSRRVAELEQSNSVEPSNAVVLPFNKE